MDLDGVFVTSRARTWLDIAPLMSVDELTVVADHLVRLALARRGLPDADVNVPVALGSAVRQPDLCSCGLDPGSDRQKAHGQ